MLPSNRIENASVIGAHRRYDVSGRSAADNSTTIAPMGPVVECDVRADVGIELVLEPIQFCAGRRAAHHFTDLYSARIPDLKTRSSVAQALEEVAQHLKRSEALIDAAPAFGFVLQCEG